MEWPPYPEGGGAILFRGGEEGGSEKPFRKTDPPAVRSGKVKRKPSHRPQRSMSVVVFHTPPDNR